MAHGKHAQTTCRQNLTPRRACTLARSQLFWMFVTLYALPVMFPRYQLDFESEYTADNCVSQLQDNSYNSTQVRGVCACGPRVDLGLGGQNCSTRAATSRRCRAACVRP